MVRKGEEPKTWFRSDRFFCVGSNWYLATREKENIGPFASRAEAVRALPQYLGVASAKRNTSFYARKMSTTGVWGINNYI